MKNFAALLILILTVSMSFAQFEDIPGDESIIILVAPDVNDNYYQSVFEYIVNYQIGFANQAGVNDHVFIVVKQSTLSYYQGFVNEDQLIPGNINDIWVRDFAPIRALGQNFKFDYAPEYLDNWTASWIENSFMNWFNNVGFEAVLSDIIIDGGNFVYDGVNKAVVTERIFTDNPSLSEEQILTYLQDNLGLEQIAIIPEEPGDVTGHSDGMVFWFSPEKIAVSDYDEPFKTELHNIIYDAFPDIEIIDLPFEPSYDPPWQGFYSAEGIYVNALATNDNIYVPVYGIEADSVALVIFNQHSDKVIIPVDAEEVCIMGGSVHCLSWEILGETYVSGDINEDGFVDVLDVVLIVNIILNVEFYGSADLNGDDLVNVLDIVALVNIILGNSE